jgi:TRAP-type uncharacterized transport system substrate-binding protein
MNPQLELILENLTQADLDDFMQLLKTRGWSTRRELVQITGKSERDIRALAEAAGPTVVRGPKGFNHFDNATLDDIHQAADIAASQGKKMLRYSLRLKRRAHARLA